MWGINAQQEIYSYDFANAQWANIPGLLTQVAVGSSNAVWGINESQEIYRWNTATQTCVNVPGALAQIAVGTDGSVWGVNAQSNIYFYDTQSSGWIQVPGQLTQIAVGNAGAVYGVNASGSIYWYNPGTGSFQVVANSAGFEKVSVGVDGDMWAIKSGTAYHYDVLHNTMSAAPGPGVVSIAVGYGAQVVALDASQNIFQWEAQAQTWVQLPGALASIGVGSNGAVWGVNSSDEIYELQGTITRPFQTLSVVPGAVLDQISVGADGAVWGVRCTSVAGSACGAETVYYFNSGTQSFEALSGAPNLTQVSVGAGNDVWGVDLNGNVYQYLAGTTPTWQSIPGELNLIQVGAGGSVWGINAAGATYAYDFGSSSWIEVPGQLGYLSVGADGAVWGLNGQLQIYRYAGGAWQNIPGSLVQVSVGDANVVWGVNAADQIYQYDNAQATWNNIPGS